MTCSPSNLLATVVAFLLASCFGADPCKADAGAGGAETFLAGELLPTGARITPLAAPAARFVSLNPNLPQLPDFTVGQAVELAVGPDGATLLALTSGYNRNLGPDGRPIPALSNEYVFVFDISGREPVKRQVLQIPNSFLGLVWRTDGAGFFVSGGVDDNIHVFKRDGAGFVEDGAPIPLNHMAGVGLDVKPVAGGLAVSPDGKRLLVANVENDSVSLVDIDARAVVAELDLRPGKIDLAKAGTAGGEYPLSVVFGSDSRAFAGAARDREILMLSLKGNALAVEKRIKLAGQPTKLIVNKDRTRLFAAADNSDTVVVLDAGDGDLLTEFPIAAPEALFPNPRGLRGASPNNLALSPDERTLFVTNAGLNAVAVVELGRDAFEDENESGGAADERDDDAKRPKNSRVVGLIPTGWYPNAAAVGRGGRALFVVNGKSNAGPNPDACRDDLSVTNAGSLVCRAKNEYIWQLSKAGFLYLPTPKPATLARLTLQTAQNNHFSGQDERRENAKLMEFLRTRIKHVVYIVKENRGYDQVLGDLEIGDGDPSLNLFPDVATPNHHALARNFVTLDRFFDSGESSNTGWQWTTAARTNDYSEKNAPTNYAGRGFTYDQEGPNRNVNVGVATLDERRASNPATPDDPDLLPGLADVAAPDASAENGGAAGAGYLWDAALRAGLTIRNYGFFGDLSRYSAKDASVIPPIRDPFFEKRQVFFAAKAALMPYTDIYFRGFDMAYPDFYRLQEWRREFAQQLEKGVMPSLTLLRLPLDHFGSFATAIDGVNTPLLQMADNDYAVGAVVETIAASPFAKETLIFIIEDDAQNSADHVDAHRSIAYVVGPYVRQRALVSKPYTTVSMLRTIEDVLGVPPLGLNDGLAEPMAEVFDRSQENWSYTAMTPQILRATKLPLPDAQKRKAESDAPCFNPQAYDALYWERAMAGQDFSQEDQLDTTRFNAALWRGVKGEDSAPPAAIAGAADLRQGRGALLADWRASTACVAAAPNRP
jgi:YVTN family beta-propeller protein